MPADHPGPAALVRLLTGQTIPEADLADLPSPWRDLAQALLPIGEPAGRLAALKAALRDRPDGATILAAIRGAAPAAEGSVVRLADVADRSVRWLWPGRLPLGKLTVLDGDPGLGKSAITLDLAARVTSHRPMPDETPSDLAGPRGVVLLTAEDGLADTVRPRLLAAGADLDRVAALTAVTDHPAPGRRAYPGRRRPTLADVAVIRQALADVDAALVVVDPIMAYLPRGVDGGREAATRAVLAQLAGLAELADVSVLVVRHLAKAARANPLYRGGGSIGIIGAARAGLLVGRDPGDPTSSRRVLATTKANLAIAPASLAYRLVPADNGSLRVAWEGPSEHTAGSLLAHVPARDEEQRRPSALAEAADILRAILADGPRPAPAAQAEARAAGISPITLPRAREALGIRPRKDQFQGAWIWELPDPSPESDSSLAHRPDASHRRRASRLHIARGARRRQS